MEAYESRLESFTKAWRVKRSTAKRAVSLKWPHPSHFIATPDTLTEAGFFFNPSWDARDNVECYFCGKCLDGWEEQDDPFALHWDKCRDTCPWAVLRCGLNEDVDRKGNFDFKDSSRQPDGKPMEKARLASFRLNHSWPHDRVKGHGANSTKMAKAGFAFTPQTLGDDTGTCLYCRVSLSGWDEDDDPLEEHHKRVKKSNLTCPFFPEAPAPKARSRTTSIRSTTRPKSRARSRQPRPETSTSHSDEDSQPAPPRPAQRSRNTSMVSASKERDTSDALRRSTRSSRAKPPPEVEEDASGTELSKSTLGQSRSKSSGKGKGKGPIEVIEEADEDDIARVVLPTKQRVKGKENVAQDAKVPRPTRHTKAPRANDTEEDARPPKRRPPKKGKATLYEREESSSDLDSESDIRPVGKRRNHVVDIESDDASAPTTPARKTEETTLSESKPVRDMADHVFAPSNRFSRSPECPELGTLQHDENPATPPPPSSSLLSVSSTTSTTKVEGHTDTETLVETLPIRENGTQLTEEERLMTVEQWIRQEIEVQYERLKRDGEAKIRLFKERAEEVRRQVEAL